MSRLTTLLRSRNTGPAPPVPPANPGTLPTDLISHWTLNEASGVRNDSHGARHLADNNTVLASAGKFGDGALFVATNNEFLSHANHADLVTGDINYTHGLWVSLTTKPADAMIISSKWLDGLAGALEYQIGWTGSGDDRFFFQIVNGGGATPAAFSTGFPIATGTLYCIVAKHNEATDQVVLKVNNNVFTAASGGGHATSGTEFCIGRRAVFSGTPNHWDGLIDSYSFWKKFTSDAEDDYLYNLGNGNNYPWS